MIPATLSPVITHSTGVNAMDAWVRKETRVASVNSSATLQHPCARRFHSASSPAASQNFFLPSSVLMFIEPSSIPPFLAFMIIGMKQSAAMTPLTAPMVPAEGGPGRLYTYLNATESDPYAAATKMSSALPYHNPGAPAVSTVTAEDSLIFSSPSPVARAMTEATRRWRRDRGLEESASSRPRAAAMPTRATLRSNRGRDRQRDAGAGHGRAHERVHRVGHFELRRRLP